MKRRVMILTLLTFIASSALAADPENTEPGGNKAGLEQTATPLLEAITAGDIDKIRGYYTTDYTFTGPDGKMVSGEERLKQMAAPGSPRQTFSDVKVRTYGSTGVVTGTATTKNSSGGTEQFRFTQTWTQQGGRWRLAAGQGTRISP
jgi:ketosteroid isomerase-like protein